MQDKDMKEVINAVVAPLKVLKELLDKVRAYFLKKMLKTQNPKPIKFQKDEVKKIIPPLFESMSLPN